MKKLTKEEKQVLYVDDEKENLDGFMYTFREDYNIFTADNARDAKKIIEANDIKIVIADQRMPDIKGTDFLEEISITHPQIIRFILTAYAEVDVILEAVNKGNVYRFISKPWDREELYNAIENALETWSLKNENAELISNLKKTNIQLKKSNQKLKEEVETRKKIQEDLTEHKTNLEHRVKSRTEEVEQINEELITSNEELRAAVEELNFTNNKLKTEIDHRSEIQQHLKISEEKFRRFLEQSTDAIALMDKNGHIIEWNKGSETILGLEKEEVIGRNIAEVEFYLQPLEKQTEDKKLFINGSVRKFLDNVRENKKTMIETEIVDKDGERKFITISIFTIETSEGILIGRIAKDITARKKMEEELKQYQNYLEDLVNQKTSQIKENEARLSLVLNNVPLAFYILQGSETHSSAWISEQVEGFTGYTRNEFYEDNGLWLKQIHPDDRERALNKFNTLKDQDEITGEYRWKSKDGNYRWFYDHAKIIRNHEGNQEQIIGIWIDITDRKNTEIQLAEYRDHLEKLVKERTEEVELVNEELKSTNEELYEKNEELNHINEQLQEEINLHKKTQRELEKYQNKLEQLVEDRTQQLKQSEEKFSKTFKFSPSFIILSTLKEGKFIDVNDVFLKKFGYEKKEITGKTAHELGIISKETRDQNARLLIDEGYYENLEVALKTKKGTIHHCISSGEVIEIGNEQYIVQVITDITDRKKAENEIKKKNQELMAVEEELRTVNEQLREVNDELKERNEMLKEANASIKESEERFRSLFEQAVDGILIGNQNGTITGANSFICRMTEYSKEDLIGRNINNLFAQQSLERKPWRYDLLKTGITVHRQREMLSKNGRIIPVEMNTKQLPNGLLQTFIRDVSDRIKAEKALKQSEEKYRTLVEGQTELIVKVNVDGEFIFVSPSYCRTFGKSEEELLGKKFMPLVHESDRKPTEEAMKKLLKPPFKAYIEQRAFTKDGWRWIGWSDTAILNEKSEVVEIIGVGRDITTRKQYEEDLIRTNNLLGAINNATPDIVFILNLIDWKFEYYNQRFNELFKYSDEEITSMDNIVMELVVEEDQEFPDYHFERLLEADDGSIIASEVRLKRKDGKYLWTLVREQVFERDMEGQPVKSVGVITDITESKLSETALKESETKFRLLFENANDPIFLMKNDIFFTCNKKTLEVFKCKREDILGHTPYEFSPEKQPNGNPSKQEAIKHIKNAIRGEISTFEWKHTRHDGSEFDAEISLNRLNLGNETYIQAIVRDVSERKQSENELREREALLKTIVDNLPFDFWARDNSGTLMLQNEYSRKLWGDLINSRIDITRIPQKIKSDWSRTFDIALHGEVVDEELDYINVNGTCIQKIVAPIKDKDKVRGALGFDIDITERKIAEKQLVENEKKFKNIFNNSSDAIAITDFQHRFIEMNEVFVRWSESTKEETSESKVTDFVPPEQEEAFKGRVRALKKSKKLQTLEANFLTKGNRRIPVEINTKAIEYEGKKAVLSVIRDITERKNTEKKVLDAIIVTEERERENFAKNLHDDLGPLLSSIRMYLNSFMEANQPDKQSYIIEQINDILKEAIQTTKQISNDLSPHILANYGLVSAVENFIERLTEHIHIDFNHNLKDSRFNSSIEITFYRIIKELINNTIKHASAQNIDMQLYTEGAQLHLLYKDDGIGFDKNIMEQVERRGMGLFNLISRIKSLNGKFQLCEVRKGACIKIEAPLNQ